MRVSKYWGQILSGKTSNPNLQSRWIWYHRLKSQYFR